MFPLHFPRRYTPACAKPPVICCRFWVRSRFVFEAHIHFRRLPFSRHFRAVQFCRVCGFVYNVFTLYFRFGLLFQGRMYNSIVFLVQGVTVCFSLAVLFQRTVIPDFSPCLRHGQSHFHCPSFLSYKDTQSFSISIIFRVKNSKYFLIHSLRAFSASERIDCLSFTKSVRQ